MTALTIAFDLDGTLVDTAPDLIASCDHVLRLAGLAPAPVAIVRPQISFGSRAMILAGLTHHGVVLPAAEVDQLWQAFLARYEGHATVHSRPFEGIREVLAREAARGTRLVVCTNKIQRMARRVLEDLDLARYFGAIAGRDTFANMKPHPDHLTGVISAAGGDPEHAVMVGDSDVDIATAKAAQIPVIAVTFGYVAEPVANYAPDAIISHYAEFDAALERVSRR